MSISINISLLSVYLNINIIMDYENKRRILVDSDGTMNIGSRYYHLWLMSQCPSMVAEYLECGTDTE